MHTRRIAFDLAAIVAAAFLVKAVVLAQLGNHPLLQPHGELDATYYVDLAQRVAEGGPLAIREPLFVSPLYVFFLAAIFETGGSLFAARLVQIVLGTAAVGLLYATARQWFGEASARLAAVLAILTGLFTFYEILILQAALDPFLTAWLLFAISRCQVDARIRWLISAGMASGLLALNRPNALVYGAAAAAGLVLTAWGTTAWRADGLRSGIRRSALFLAGLTIVLVPNLIRNYAVSGEPILISSHGGLNFYIGNSADADGTYQRLPGITPSIVGQTRDSTRVAEAAMGRSLSSGEVSSYFYGRAWEWIAAHPSAWLRLFARKIALLVNRTDVPLNYSYAYYSRDESSWLRILVVGPWLILPLGLVGLFLKSVRREARGYWVWASFVPIYGLSVATFFVADRYRMPLLIPLCASGAATIVRMADAVRHRHARSLLAIAPAALALAVAANWNLHADAGRGTEQTRKAVWMIQQGAFEDARRYVDAIAAHHSHPGVLRFKVGDALAAAGRVDEAIQRYREALAIDRGQPAIQLALGQALVARDNPREAIPLLRSAFDAGYQPDMAAIWLMRALILTGRRQEALTLLSGAPIAFAAAHETTAGDLGSIAVELDAPVEAERWLRTAAGQKPDDAGVHEQLGVALLMQGKSGEALASLETACRLDPSSVGARVNLAVAYAQLGRFDEARSDAERARRLAPDDPRVADLVRRLAVQRRVP